MLASPIARVYSEALFAIAEETGRVEDLGQELQGFADLVREHGDVEEFLASPVLEPAVKVKHLKKALEGNASDTVADFLCLLVEKRRTQALPSIVGAYRTMADRHANRARVEVQTATPLSDALRQEIESVLKSTLSKEVVIDSQVEPAIMGGAVVAVGDRVYDGSIRNRLNAFRKQILRSGGYEAQG